MCRQSNLRNRTANAAAAQDSSLHDEEEVGALESFSSAFAEMCAASEVCEPAPTDEPPTSVPEPSEPVANIDHTSTNSASAAASSDDTSPEAAAGLTSLTNTSNPISIDSQHYDRLKG